MSIAEGIDYAPLAADLRRYLGQKPGSYGICCQDVNTGKIFGIDEDELFVQASCLKVAYVLYLYEQVAAGHQTLEQRLAYRKVDDYSDGSGYLQYIAAEGDRFTLRALAGVAITLSDNIAYRMIKRFLGAPNVLRYMEQLGMKHPQPNGEHCTTPRDMACCLRGVLDFAAREPGLGPGCWTIWHIRSGTTVCRSCCRTRSGWPTRKATWKESPTMSASSSCQIAPICWRSSPATSRM